MSAALWVLGIAASLYAIVWGASWHVGDRSFGFMSVVVRDGSGSSRVTTVTSHPGVLFGGLLPVPTLLRMRSHGVGLQTAKFPPAKAVLADVNQIARAAS